MPHDDRDRTFEKALARHLRSSSSSGTEGAASAGAPLESCPDAEILAAYHERTLSSGELIFWKSHVVSCSHCQFVLAHLVATDKIALDVPPAKDPLLAGERTLSRKPRDHHSRFSNGEKRPPSWRWVLLIPAGAIAAGLVAYISLQPPRSSHTSPSSSVEVAENRPSPAISPSAKTAPTLPGEAKEKDQSAAPTGGAITGAASSNRNESPKALQDKAQLIQQAPNRSSANAPQGPSVSMQKQQQQQLAPRLAAGASGDTQALDKKKLEAQAPARTPQNGRLAASPAPPPPPPTPQEQPGFVADGSLAAPSAEKVSPPAPALNAAAPRAKSVNTDTVASTAETVEISSGAQSAASQADSRAMLRAAALQNPHVFVAPDGKHLWRLGSAGSLERSNDEGLKWSPQSSGVNADLLAGSAPSARVAWVVGNSGTILRTIDGGAHWTKLDSPVTNNLTGVRATDAFHASVWFVADPQTGLIKTYETADGGATWSAVPAR